MTLSTMTGGQRLVVVSEADPQRAIPAKIDVYSLKR